MFEINRRIYKIVNDLFHDDADFTKVFFILKIS
jgi:hypothetical protein